MSAYVTVWEAILHIRRSAICLWAMYRWTQDIDYRKVHLLWNLPNIKNYGKIKLRQIYDFPYVWEYSTSIIKLKLRHEHILSTHNLHDL